MRIFVLYAALLSCFLTCGCSLSPLPQQKKQKDEIVFALHDDPLSLDPRIGGNSRSQIVTRVLFEGLTRLDNEGTPSLALAQSYTVSEDATTYTFTLKPTRWSHGTPVTAADFVYAWKSVISKQVASAFVYAFFPIKNARAIYQGRKDLENLGVKALDPSTLEVTLEHPTPYFLELLANPLFSPVCQSVAENNPGWTHEEFVSNGPFVLDHYQLKSSIRLKKNPLYWDKETVKSHALSFIIVEDSLTAFNLFMTGEIVWYGDPFLRMPLELSEDLQKKGALRINPNGKILWVLCNTQKKALSSPEIRNALSLGMNTTSICKNLLEHTDEHASSFVQKHLSLLPPSPPQKALGKAKHALHLALKDVQWGDPTNYSLHLLVGANSPLLLVAQALQHEMKKNLDVNILIEIGDSPLYWSRLLTANFDLALVSWCTWFNDPIYTLDYLRERNNGINATGWSSFKYKELLHAADNELCKEKRNALLQEAESLAMKELPIIPLCNQAAVYAKSNIRGELFPSEGNLDLKSVERIPKE